MNPDRLTRCDAEPVGSRMCGSMRSKPCWFGRLPPLCARAGGEVVRSKLVDVGVLLYALIISLKQPLQIRYSTIRMPCGKESIDGGGSSKRKHNFVNAVSLSPCLLLISIAVETARASLPFPFLPPCVFCWKSTHVPLCSMGSTSACVRFVSSCLLHLPCPFLWNPYIHVPLNCGCLREPLCIKKADIHHFMGSTISMTHRRSTGGLKSQATDTLLSKNGKSNSPLPPRLAHSSLRRPHATFHAARARPREPITAQHTHTHARTPAPKKVSHTSYIE